jgi:phosphate:Na+ symporter
MRTAIFHLLFNVVTVTLGLVFVSQLTAAATAMPGTGIGRDIANAHILFNTLGVVLFIGFVGQIAALLERLIPPKPATPATLATPGDGPNTDLTFS